MTEQDYSLRGHGVSGRVRHHVRRVWVRGAPPGTRAADSRCSSYLVAGREGCMRLSRGKWSLAGGALPVRAGTARRVACRRQGRWPSGSRRGAARARGWGIFNAGASTGSALAPPVMTGLTLAYGWKLGLPRSPAATGLLLSSCSGCCSTSRRIEIAGCANPNIWR